MRSLADQPLWLYEIVCDYAREASGPHRFAVDAETGFGAHAEIAGRVAAMLLNKPAQQIAGTVRQRAYERAVVAAKRAIADRVPATSVHAALYHAEEVMRREEMNLVMRVNVPCGPYGGLLDRLWQITGQNSMGRFG